MGFGWKRWTKALWMGVAAVGSCQGPGEDARGAILGGALGDIRMGDPVDDVREALEPLCGSVRLVESDSAHLPFASATESHLICSDLRTGGGETIEGAAFSFGDGELHLVEAHGAGAVALGAIAGEAAGSFAGRTLYPASGVVVQADAERAWVLSDASMHANLFLWSNPLLDTSAPERFTESAERPAVLRFGETIEALEPELESASAFTMRREISPAWLPTRPDSQVQIDCFGIEYAGMARKVEAVFGDGRLELAWILTGKGEEDRVRAALVRAFGEPVHVSDEVEAFDGWRVALRKDKPEVLMVSDRLAPMMRAQFTQGNE